MLSDIYPFEGSKGTAEASAFGVATWNVEWATPSSERGQRISTMLAGANCDITVITEGSRGLLPGHGHTVEAGGDWGYGPQAGRRKVLVWSRFPLELEFLGIAGATLGRLVVATAATQHGPLRVVGVCIPWRDAHVSTGRRDAQPWSEHEDYLDRLEGVLAGLDDDVPTLIAGDFNQRIPRDRQPVRVAARLGEALAGWTIHTAGAMPNGPHIDHIATNPRLVLESVRDWPATDHHGRLSDHAGVACRLSVAQAHQGGKSAAVGPVAGQGNRTESAARKSGSKVVSADRDPATGGATAPPRRSESKGGLSPELRTEIEDILRHSSDGLEHGAAFRLREQGLSDAEIAAARGVQVSSTRVWLRSLDALLTGTLPTSKTGAETNSYGYRELLNHDRSDELDRYVKVQLHKLKELNPSVRFDPLQTRPFQYRVGKQKPKREESLGDGPCSRCGTLHAGEC